MCSATKCIFQIGRGAGKGGQQQQQQQQALKPSSVEAASQEGRARVICQSFAYHRFNLFTKQKS